MGRLPLYGRGGVRAHALVDAADLEWLSRWRWHLNGYGYAVRNPAGPRGRSMILMHRQLLDLVPGDGFEVDHLNGDRLDNRRENLRIGTRPALAQNIERTGGSSRYRGVSWDAKRQGWRATVVVDGRQVLNRLFLDEHEAALAAWEARREHMAPVARDAYPDPALAQAGEVSRVVAPRRSRKLSDEQVAEARQRIGAGETQKAVAAGMGISAGKLSEILSGKRYGPAERPLTRRSGRLDP